MSWAKRIALTLGIVAVMIAVLFAINGLAGGWKVPETGRTSASERTEPVGEVRVLALNMAKCDFHEGGISFASKATVRSRLDRIADVIRAERADVVLLSEVVIECAPVPLNQAEHLAEQCAFAHFATGENYSFGLPWFRIRTGNAVLSKFPLAPLEVVQLAGGRPFWSPTNNRRTLWCEITLRGTPLLVASIRNDSFDIENNLAQTREILERMGTRTALLGGDFNAEPGTPPMNLLAESGRFAPFPSEPRTFHARNPTRRIDHVLAPVGWRALEQRVVDTGVSDHLAVVAVFAIP